MDLGVRYELTCDDTTYTDFRDAWGDASSVDLSDCEGELTRGGTLSDVETEAVTAAEYDEPEDIVHLYELCAEVVGYYAEKGQELSDSQVVEARGMLTLCPGAPQAKRVQSNIDRVAALADERSAGVRFGEGSYRVGKEVKPGTYYIPKADKGCYWQRLDKRGEILDNNFVSAATRVEVTIRKTDYTFASEGCGGEWRRVA